MNKRSDHFCIEIWNHWDYSDFNPWRKNNCIWIVSSECPMYDVWWRWQSLFTGWRRRRRRCHRRFQVESITPNDSMKKQIKLYSIMLNRSRHEDIILVNPTNRPAFRPCRRSIQGKTHRRAMTHRSATFFKKVR